MMMEKTTKRKRVKLTEGDVFEFAVPDGRLGYGIIVKRGGLKNGGTPYIAMFSSVHKERPDLDKVVSEDVVLGGWTMDALVYHGRWNVIAHDMPLPRVPFPNFKVQTGEKFYVTDVEGQRICEATNAEMELLDYQWSRAPIGFQHAFEALHGFGEWREDNEKLTPAYCQERITRPAK